MDQSQILPAMLGAALSGAAAGFFALRSHRAWIIATVLVIVFNVFGWAAYGFRSNIESGATFTFTQVIAGFALALPGLVIFFGGAAAVASFTTGLISRAVCRRAKPAAPSQPE
jgi:hypothetical protein